MENLLELAKRCEQATGPDRDLDNDIHEAVFRGPALSGEEVEAALARGECAFSGCLVWRGALTASIDAALALVPEGMAWQIDSDGPTYPAGASVGLHPTGGELFNPRWTAGGETPALALCAAALKARAASCDTHPKGGDAKQGSVHG